MLYLNSALVCGGRDNWKPDIGVIRHDISKMINGFCMSKRFC